MNTELMEKLIRIEAKLDVLLSQSGAKTPDVAAEPVTQVVQIDWYRFTTKQHVALQGVLHYATNAEIASRLNVTENTAKVHVRSICKKLRVKNRKAILRELQDAYRAVDDDAYMRGSGGLPKDWWETYSTPDPFEELYAQERGRN